MGWMQSVQQGSAGRRRLASLVGAVAVGLAGVAMSLPASAQVTNTRHNLGTTAGNPAASPNQFSGTAEICVFCHTPHGADTSAAVPLWNRTLGLTLPAVYQTYDSLGTSTLEGKTVSVGSVSIACLSCHDGTQAMSAVLNAPGSGTVGPASWTGGTWSGANNTGGGLAGGKLTGIAALGTDLRNDHPIGIQYAGGGANQTTPTPLPAAMGDADFVQVQSTTLNGNRVWWVDTAGGAAGTRQKTDIALYSRAALGGTAVLADAQPFVECASCHDPHTTNATFLRISNAGSAVCLACHVK